jgi:hypothetical protein
MITFAYLVRISKKYELDTHRLLECIHYAWIRGESSFDDISIKRRQITGDNGIFLIKQDNHILTQIRLTSKLLEYLGKTDFRKLSFEDYSVSKARPEPEDLMIKDLEGNLDVIDDAKRQADWVFVACHHHHTDGTNGQIPPKAVQSFAHACIDAGAHGLFGSGPHQIQGIEIYNGKPIFYSFPDFIQQRDLMPKLPQTFYENLGMGFENTPMDAMDERAKTVFARLYQDPAHSESGIAVSRFKKHEVVEIKLYPADLGLGKPRWQFGRPKLADRTLGEKIILRWAKLSEQFGTKIELKDGVGEVKLP